MFTTNSLVKHIAVWQLLSQLVSTQEVLSPAIFIPSTVTDFSVPVRTISSYAPFATSLIFGSYNYFSIVAVGLSATTYASSNHYLPFQTANCRGERLDRRTIVNGPSTAGATYYTDACGTIPSATAEVNCVLTGPAPVTTATCTMTVSDGINPVSTFTVTENSSEIAPEPVTITAGLGKLSQFGGGGTVTVSLTTASVNTKEAPLTIQTSMPTSAQNGTLPLNAPTPEPTAPTQNANGAESLSFATGKMVVPILMVAAFMNIM